MHLNPECATVPLQVTPSLIEISLILKIFNKAKISTIANNENADLFYFYQFILIYHSLIDNF